MARQLYCRECKQWFTPSPKGGVTWNRKQHARMHADIAALFATPDLLALDAELDFHYNMEL